MACPRTKDPTSMIPKRRRALRSISTSAFTVALIASSPSIKPSVAFQSVSSVCHPNNHHRLNAASLLNKEPETSEDEIFEVAALSSPQSKATSDAYGAQQITVLSGLEPVRKRPGMYIGSTGPDGLHHLVYEVLDNSVDEALAGHASLITMVLHDETREDPGGRNRCTIADDGRGIPTDLHPTTQISALETVLTVLHAGGKFDNAQDGAGYKVSGGLHGVGISVVNALSESVEVRVDRKVGKKKKDPIERKMMTFARGTPVGDMMTVDMDEDWTALDIENGWEGIVFQTNDSKAASSLGDESDGSSKGKSKSKAKAKAAASTSASDKKSKKIHCSCH